jgi:flagellar biosynthesis protein FlhA
LSKQLISNPNTILICGAVLVLICLIPGFPKLQILSIAAVLLVIGYLQMRSQAQPVKTVEEETAKMSAEEKRRPENVLNLLQVEQIEFEFGYGIVPLVDKSLGGDLLDRVIMIRRQCAVDLGIIIPSIRMRDNVRLGPNEYRVLIKGSEVAKGEVMPDHYLAINTDGVEETITGIETTEPTFGLPALWITKKQRERAELLGYTTIDPLSVITTHLMEVIKQHSSELIDRQQVKMLIDNLAQQQPTLVEEVVPKMFTYGDIQKILVRLLRENVPIKDMTTIIETLADYGSITKNPDDLTEYVRQNLSRVITQRFFSDDDILIVALDSKVEQIILEKTKLLDTGTVTILEPEQLQGIYKSTKEIIDKASTQGKRVVVITAPVTRAKFKKIIEQVAPGLTVLSYAEVEPTKQLQIESIIKLP